LAGTFNVAWMFTVTSGYAELSTWPTSVLVTMGTSPFIPLTVLVTSQVTLGVSFGVRP
jgi:hypothetical protein